MRNAAILVRVAVESCIDSMCFMQINARYDAKAEAEVISWFRQLTNKEIQPVRIPDADPNDNNRPIGKGQKHKEEKTQDPMDQILTVCISPTRRGMHRVVLLP